jgi:RimJ/RimL family protein N-acetyltransferase
LLTSRLLLREFTAADEPAVLAYQSDPRYLRFSPEEQGSGLVQMFLDWKHEQPRCRFQWAVLLPADGRLIGNCGIRKRSADAREADIGFELDPGQWGRGYATELAATLLRFGFVELGLHRITAHCLAENTASARVLEKAGLRQEGRLRENEWMWNRWWDTLLYGILEPEWREGRGPDGAG